jgi:LysM repeat protein
VPSFLRYAGPGSIALFAVIAVIVIAVSAGGSNNGGGAERSTGQEQTQPRTTKRFYTVKDGDNLGTISEKTGVPVEQLQALNPNVDPQALIAGQRLKLGR